MASVRSSLGLGSARGGGVTAPIAGNGGWRRKRERESEGQERKKERAKECKRERGRGCTHAINGHGRIYGHRPGEGGNRGSGGGRTSRHD